MKNTSNYLIVALLALLPLGLAGQTRAKLLPDKLTINNPGNPFTTSEYGYLSVYLRDNFDEARVQPTFISVGDDLIYNLIDRSNGFQMIQTGVAIPNDNSKMNLAGLFLGRNFSGSMEGWTFDKTGVPAWLTGGKTALRIGRLETNTPQADDRTALIIEPEALNIGINTGTSQPIYRMTITDNSTTYANNDVGTLTVFNSGNVTGSPIVGIFNNTGNLSGTTIYALGKIGGFWTGGGRNAGVHGHVTGIGSAGYGVLGTAGSNINSPTAWGALAFSNSSQFYAVYANGEQFSTSSSLWATSDRRLKREIQPLKGALEIVQKLEPKTYKYRQDGNYKKLATPTETQYGFIAQEVEEVLPLLVRDVELQLENPKMPQDGSISQDAPKTETFKAIQSLGFIPILTEAVKEVDKKFDEQVSRLERENQELKDRVSQLETAVQRLLAASGTESTILELSSAKLGQNTPNPTNGKTQIRYEVPTGITDAVLRITSAEGKLIKQIAIAKTGIGVIEIDAQTLSSGTYFYTLLLDGKLFETRQMVISR